MSVSEKDVRHIAALARLGMPEQRVPTLVAELNRILEHMDVLQRVDLSQHATDALETRGMPLRIDEPGSVPLQRTREQFAPSMRDGFFLVPRLDTHGTSGSSSDDDEGQA